MRYLYLIVMTLTFSTALSCKETSHAQALDKDASASTHQWLKVVNVADDDSLNLRAAAESKANIVYRIPYDSANLLKIGAQGNWTNVRYRGMSGWVHSKYVEAAQHRALSDSFGGNLFCIGTGPHWNIKTRDHIANFKKLSDRTELVLNDIVRQGINQNNLWMGSFTDVTGPGGTISAIFHKTASCSDGMSDESYPFSITVIDNQTQLLSGCCKIIK